MTGQTPSDSRLLEQIRINTAPGAFFEPDRAGRVAPASPMVRLIAFYLPQFHPIPENDAWWGRGFTEWTNVTKALPRYVGHVQPRLPADLGFYDLRLTDVLRAQAILARRYGLHGFCFHHYWFNGRRLLQTPLELLLAHPDIDLPFCVNWANENWTRRWDGHDQEILLAQAYSEEDDVAFARSLLPIVRDPRYIRIDGRPVVMIYRPGLLPNPLATIRRWRVEFARAGEADPYVVMAQSFDDRDPRAYGIDAAAEFPPHKIAVTAVLDAGLQVLGPDFNGTVLDYADVARYSAALPNPPYKLFRGIVPSWDNEPRRPGSGLTLAHSTPALYGEWLSAICRSTLEQAGHPDERIVFVNAWNEWGEGAYLEPDRHFGHAYLAETARVLARLAGDATEHAAVADGVPRVALISHDARLHGAQLIALAIARTLVADHGVRLTILLGGPGDLTPEFEALAPTESVPGDFTDPAPWRQAATRLVADGVTAVLSNTLVSARVIGILRDAGLRVIQLVHELPSLIRQYGLEDAARDAATHAVAIVFPSAYIRDRFVEVSGPIDGRVVLRHQGLYMRRLSPDERLRKRAEVRRALGIDAAHRVVLGVGYGDVRKGFDLWPSLARAVLKSCPEAVFLWVGRIDPGLQLWLEHDLKVAGLQDRLLLPGPSADMAGIYAAADAYALTSREDPFPSVVIEAMASGLPTIVFEESGGIVELVRDAGGMCVPYLDVGAMAAGLVRLLLDDATAVSTGAALAARIAADFDYTAYGADLLALAMPPSLSISVIVPNYNYARHLRRRLESIWAQSVTILDIILLDDASTDESAAVMAELVDKSPVPVRVVRNDCNSGSVSRQWASGVALARGDLVWIAEADDFADPGFLAALRPAFDDPDTVLAYTESRMVDEDGRVVAPDYRGYVADIDAVRWTTDFRASGADEVAHALAIKNTIPNVSAALFRRTALAAVLDAHLDEMVSYRNVADWLCYMRLLVHGGSVSFVARPLNNHRRHAGSVTLAAADRRHLDEIAAMQDAAAAMIPVQPSVRAAALRYRRAVAEQFGLLTEEAA